MSFFGAERIIALIKLGNNRAKGCAIFEALNASENSPALGRILTSIILNNLSDKGRLVVLCT